MWQMEATQLGLKEKRDMQNKITALELSLVEEASTHQAISWLMWVQTAGGAMKGRNSSLGGCL